MRFWAGARQAAGHGEESSQAATVGALRAELAARPELAKVARIATFLVDGQAASDQTSLAAHATVDVLPPFAGG